MNKIITLVAAAALSLSTVSIHAQDDKAKRPSPPAKVTVTTDKGVTIGIDYSQPSVKGRTIGKEIAPYGQVWRTGANEATVFEINKNVTINGKSLPAGKYGLYTIPGEKQWTIIFSKKSNLWGSDGYAEADDALRFTATPTKSKAFTEKMNFQLDKTGLTSLMWGDVMISFKVD